MKRIHNLPPLSHAARSRVTRCTHAAIDGILALSLVLILSVGRSNATESLLYSFAAGSDGSVPWAGLIVDQSGVLYGTTRYGGGSGCTQNAGCGTVFALTPPTIAGGVWTEALLHSFIGGADGASPMAGLLAGKSGALYGTTESGGASNAGTVFELTPPPTPGGAWTENFLYSFTGGTDGSQPMAGLSLTRAERCTERPSSAAHLVWGPYSR